MAIFFLGDLKVVPLWGISQTLWSFSTLQPLAFKIASNLEHITIQKIHRSERLQCPKDRTINSSGPLSGALSIVRSSPKSPACQTGPLMRGPLGCPLRFSYHEERKSLAMAAAGLTQSRQSDLG